MADFTQRDLAAEVAFNEYVIARKRLDENLTFENAIAAKDAWLKFQELYCGHTDRLPASSELIERMALSNMSLVQQ